LALCPGFIILESISMRFLKRWGASPRYWLASLLAGIALMTVSSGAWALTTCTGAAQAVTVSMPANISVPRDAAVGTPLSEWVTTPATTSWWTCSATVQEAIGTGFSALLTGSGATFTDTSVVYNVFNTSLSGVGIAIGYKAYANGCGWLSAWKTVPLSNVGSLFCNATALYGDGGQLQARLVKTGPITAGTVSAASIAKAQLYANGAYNTTWPVTFSTTATQVQVQSCVTPDVQVPLGQHKVSELKGVGTFTSSTAFNIALNSCPTGMTSVSYQIDALTTILDSSASVVALDSRSSAAGAGVQLLDGSGNVFALGTPKVFSGYSGATGGNLTIPLQARYYQTGSTVTGGIANTAMTFTMTYQ
jgi:major type 1 subunit fimbrin (pilin)